MSAACDTCGKPGEWNGHPEPDGLDFGFMELSVPDEVRGHLGWSGGWFVCSMECAEKFQFAKEFAAQGFGATDFSCDECSARLVGPDRRTPIYASIRARNHGYYRFCSMKCLRSFASKNHQIQ